MLIEQAKKLKSVVAAGKIEDLSHDELVTFARMFPEVFLRTVPMVGDDGVVRESEQVVLPLGDDLIIKRLRDAGRIPKK